MATKRTTKPAPQSLQPINTYGCSIKGKDQWYYDRWCFTWRKVDNNAPCRLELFKRIANRINPTYFEWHPWAEKMVEACCEERWVGVSGCSSSGKTHNISGFACAWWLCNPTESSVIFCSTTAKALRRRGWAKVAKFRATIPGPPLGEFVTSQMIWRAEHGNDENAIIGIAVEEGQTEKVADNIKGFHTARQMVIIDEATAVPPGIFDAITNLYSFADQNGGEFVLVMLGNPRSRLDEFGKWIEPLRGWQSVTPDDEEWFTTPKFDGKPGICIRFDAEKSPNITMGQSISKYLPNKERVENARRAAGHENSPTYWSNERGFPPPEGLNKNVFAESMLDLHGAYDKQVFTGENFMILGALDPARTGGDKAMLRFFKMGYIRPEVFGIECGPPMQVKLNAKSSNPIDYQITEQVQRECAKVMCFGPGATGHGYVCPPDHFGVDATGGGADLVDIMQRLWSAKVMRVGFGEKASDDACSHEDIRLASEVYMNRRSEMYFRAANATKTGQLKGIDRETAKELVTIEFDDSKAKIKLMSKEDYKKKFGKSPDASDCFTAGTLVKTPEGDRAIETLAVGDLVTTPFGNVPIAYIHVQEVDSITTVEFSNGTVLSGKGAHKVFTYDEGWVRLDTLVIDNTIASALELPIWSFLSSLFTKDESTAFKLQVDTIKIKTGSACPSAFFTELSGRSTTVQFLKVCASIIRMAIGLITESKTWNYESRVNIAECTPLSDSKFQSIKRPFLSVWQRLVRRLKSGTLQMRARLGIGKTVNLCGAGVFLRAPAHAECAVSSSPTNPFNTSNGARIDAGKKRTGVESVIKLLGTALSAAKVFLHQSITQRRLAPVRVQTESGPKRSVFNLTLQRDNVYFANGILVDNCLVIGCEVARRLGFKLIAVGQTVYRAAEFDEVVAKIDDVYASVDYAPEEMIEDDYAEVENIY